MILTNNGIQTPKFYLPPFQLNKGEIAIIRLKNSFETYDIEKELRELLSGNLFHQNIIYNQKFSFAGYKKPSSFSKLMHRNTVKNYLKRNANLTSPFASKIYEIDWIKPDINLNGLAGTPRIQLYIYCTLSKTNYLLFDLHGLDDQGRIETFQMVKKYIKELGGAAIMFDTFDGLESLCDIYIELEQYNI